MSTGHRRPLKVGLYVGLFEGFLGGRSPAWADIMAMAQQAEAVGFDSVWLPDHVLIQFDPAQDPLGVWECTSMLSALAVATSRIELGTLVLCAGFRNPAMLALMADTIDEISGGRLILGLGAGYHDPEYRAFGYPTDHRYTRFAEAIRIIHGLLNDGHIDFEGRYHQARDCVLRLRGPRAGGPPLLVGTRGPRMLRLTAQYAALWNIFLLAMRSRPEDLQPSMGLLDSACGEVGRDPTTLARTATVHWSASDPPEGMPSWIGSRYGPPLTGAPEEVADVVRAFARAGVSHLQVLVWPHTPAGIEAFAPVLEALDRRT